MTIPYFSTNQNIVFIPALLALLVATVVICLPIMFAPALRRSSRRTPLLAVAAVLAVAGLVGTAWFAAAGFRTLGDERARVQASIERTYGVRLDAGQVGELVDNGRPEVALPAQAAAAGLPKPTGQHPLRLVPTATGADTYALTFGGKPLRAS